MNKISFSFYRLFISSFFVSLSICSEGVVYDYLNKTLDWGEVCNEVRKNHNLKNC